MWITSMGNHGAAGGISERRHSSCSSYIYPCVEFISKKPRSIFSFSIVSQSFFMEDKDLFFLHGWYNGCWWPGDTRSQGISSHCIDLVWRRINTALSSTSSTFIYIPWAHCLWQHSKSQNTATMDTLLSLLHTGCDFGFIMIWLTHWGQVTHTYA